MITRCNRCNKVLWYSWFNNNLVGKTVEDAIAEHDLYCTIE